MIDKDALKRLAEVACDAAIQGGAEFADVRASHGRNLRVELEKNAIKSSDAKLGGGLSVRAIYRGGVGWSSTDKLTPEAAAEAGMQAAKLSKLAEPDPDFQSLPSPPASYPTVEGLADPALARMDIKEIVGFGLRNMDDALLVDPHAIVEGGFSVGFSADAFVNSLGISLADNGSHISGSITAVVRRGDDVGSFYDFDSARVLADFVPEGLGVKATEQALKFLGSRKMQTGRMSVILGPLSSRSIFYGVVGNADAEDIQRGRSFMIGKLGQKIASDALTLTDDPLIPRGLGSRYHDYEGSPSKPLVVMRDGVLVSYLYSSYTAAKAGVEPTGHGTRGGGAAASNIVPKLGAMTADQIIKDTREGIYINRGGISPNSANGDVSGSVDFGFKIENGEMAYPIESTMVGGNFLDMLQNIDAISSDYREEPGSIMPTLRIQDVLVAGGK